MRVPPLPPTCQPRDISVPPPSNAFPCPPIVGFHGIHTYRSKVAAELEAQQINPIAADALVLDTMLERAFDRAQEVKSKQMALTVEQGERDAETEDTFFASILFQRDQVRIFSPSWTTAVLPYVISSVILCRNQLSRFHRREICSRP